MKTTNKKKPKKGGFTPPTAPAKIGPAVFAKNLRSAMKTLGLKQIDLARKSDLTRSAVCELLKGKRDPQLTTIIKVLRVIPVKFEKLTQGVKL